MSLTALPWVIQIHLYAALAAVAVGPFALLARKGSTWHRSAGYTWVFAMLVTAISSLFIRSGTAPNLAGYSWIHLLTVATFVGLSVGVWGILHGRRQTHQQAMWSTYLGGCLIAGAFTLLPNRLLGQLVWGQWLGWA